MCFCEGKHGLPLSAVVRFVKWAYCYQHWDFFDYWLPRAMAAAEVCLILCLFVYACLIFDCNTLFLIRNSGQVNYLNL